MELIDGQQVRVSSLYGECILNCQVTQAVRAGELFATFQSPDIFLNRVTGDQRDAMVDTPQYKVTAVRVESEVGAPNAPSSSASSMRPARLTRCFRIPG